MTKHQPSKAHSTASTAQLHINRSINKEGQPGSSDGSDLVLFIDLLRHSSELVIIGMACQVTGVMMRAESSILELVEMVSGMANAAAFREIYDSSCRSHLRSVVAPTCTASRAREGSWELLYAAIACEA